MLGLIVARGPLSLAELAELEGLNPTMLSRVVGRLQELELIDRIPDPADLRSASVVTTAVGERVDQEVKARRAAAVAQCLDLLTAGHESALTEALPALEALAEAMRLATPRSAPPGRGRLPLAPPSAHGHRSTFGVLGDRLTITRWPGRPLSAFCPVRQSRLR